MDLHVKEFYRQFSDKTPDGKFHRAIALHEAPDLSWKSLHKKFPCLCKGWYELTLLDTADRIEFIRDYWLASLPYHPKLSDFLTRFFDSLDDIGVYLYQNTFEDPFEADIVYSLKNGAGFFRGSTPATDAQIEEANGWFSGFIFPRDYQAFLKIHNGFWKTTDTTGLIKIERVLKSYVQLQESLIERGSPILKAPGQIIDPKKLVPFYESFGMPYYQCFWAEWYPEQEAGNLYLSADEPTIADVSSPESWAEALAFPSFLDWLMFYLERID